MEIPNWADTRIIVRIRIMESMPPNEVLRCVAGKLVLALDGVQCTALKKMSKSTHVTLEPGLQLSRMPQQSHRCAAIALMKSKKIKPPPAPKTNDV